MNLSCSYVVCSRKLLQLLVLAVGLSGISVSTNVVAATGDFAAQLLSDERWESMRLQLFDEREIDELGGVITLNMPGRAFDSARVPVTINSISPQSDDRYIEKIYLIVDNNPLPVAGTFTFEPNKGWDTISTELRVNEYTSARVVAEMNTGELFMDSSFIKAVGGCSAPPSSYERSDKSLLGKFDAQFSEVRTEYGLTDDAPKFSASEDVQIEVPLLAEIRITHPNASGMQFDQFTRTYIPPHYIHTMGVEFNGDQLFKLDTNFSMSQDPKLGFNFSPPSEGELLIYAIDSKDKRFEQVFNIDNPQHY